MPTTDHRIEESMPFWSNIDIIISVSLSNVLYCICDVSVASRCNLYLNEILFTLNIDSLRLKILLIYIRQIHAIWKTNLATNKIIHLL